MYCLSQFCCLCFRNEVKLKLLHEATSGDATFIKIANVVIPEIQLAEVSHVMSVCEDCANFVTEMHAFRRQCVDNNFLLVEYIEMLSSSGGEIGTAQIQITENSQRNVSCEDESNRTGLVESEDVDYVVSRDPEKVYRDETASSDSEEEVVFEIMMNDDLEDKYSCKEEIMNDDEDESNSPDLVTRLGPPKDSEPDYMKYCERNTLYKCKICKRSLITKSNFKKHVSLHKTRKRCETCRKYFSSAYLKIHSLIHTGEKPHKCETCGVRFRSRSNLGKHFRVHTKEKPYKCNICGKPFRLLSDSKRHRLVHTGEEPHRCNVCGKCFALSSNLTKHIAVHAGHECDICKKKFRFSIQLKKHAKCHE